MNSHFMCVIVLLMGLGILDGSLRAIYQEEPIFLDKKLSYWLDQAEKGKEPKNRRRGILAIEQIGSPGIKKSIPLLNKMLREDASKDVRSAAARAMGRLISRNLQEAREEKKDNLPRYDESREGLSRALRVEKEAQVRAAAALALGEIGMDARAAVPALAMALQDANPEVVRAAVGTLRRMGRDSREAQMELLTLVARQEAEYESRIDAVVCLGQIDPDVTSVLPVFQKILLDSKADPRLRKAMAESLAKMGKAASDATPILSQILVSPQTPPELRLSILTTLEQFGPSAKDAIPSLIKVVSDPVFIKQMGDESRLIRCLALQTLSRMEGDFGMGRKDVLNGIYFSLDDPHADVCVSAIETLATLSKGKISSEEMKDLIEKLDLVIRRESRKVVRDAAQAARDRLQSRKEKSP